MSDLFAKLAPVRSRLQQMSGGGALPFCTPVERLLGPTRAVMAGREVLMFGANNYLGASFDPDVIEAARAALAEGTGTTGSRVASGTLSCHLALQSDLASAYDKRHALIFTTGHQANLAAVGGLCGPDDAVLLDAECHASLFDGARLSGASLSIFRHQDVGDLARRLARLAREGRPTLVIAEGLYSISGDQAPVRQISEVCREHGAVLLVDEAHSLGVYGPRGLGASEAEGVLEQVDLITGTFSKSLGSTGGFLVSDHPDLPLLHFVARSYVFTASGPPAAVEAARKALSHIVDPARGPEQRAILWANVGAFRAALARRGVRLSAAVSPIVGILLGDEARTISAWQHALDLGLYVNLVLPPGCRQGEARLRASVSAAHSSSQIEDAAAILAEAVCLAS